MAACVIAGACAFSACGLFQEEDVVPTATPEVPTLLVNGGFEQGVPPWTGDPEPHVTGSLAHGGGSSLELNPGSFAIQSVLTGQLPEFISGFYRVNEWPADGAGFLEAIVTVRQADPSANKAVHLAIAGLERQPEGSTEIFVFLSRDAPVVGEWTYFAYPLPDAFIRFAGGYPETWESIDITLSFSGTATLVAWFDEIYLGTQAGNPNRPAEALDD